MENLPIFLNTTSTKTILEETARLVPENTSVYLFGGAVRNAIYFDHFGEEITQRDYDCIVIGDGEAFAQQLLEHGFVYGNKNNEKAKVLKKARVENPSTDFSDSLYLDCKIYDSDKTALEVLNTITDFSIGGVALNLKEIESSDWKEKIVAIPHAIDDIKQKQLRIIKAYSPSIYKIIRLVSRDFKVPSQKEIDLCLEKLKDISQEKFDFNVEKTIRYVGSEEKVRELMKELGITEDILNFGKIILT